VSGPPPSVFKDHFSANAASYARYRPDYPPELFAYLAGLAPSHRRAWDCATGNGQAALGLAEHFTEVVATDASSKQLAEAAPHARVTYRAAPAEDSGLPEACFDLVTAAQAAHWFDRPRFWREARRVLVPDGIVAVWCYELFRSTPEIDRVIDRLYHDVVGPHWPPERRLTEDGFRSLDFPFPEIPPPEFQMEKRWTLAELQGYLTTWSAARRYREARGGDPVDEVREDLARAWGPPEEARSICWEIGMRVGRST
jgi:SAM-dependent methyltransferase